MVRGATGVYCVAPQSSSCCTVCGRIPFVHPNSASPSRLAPVGGPGATCLCTILLWDTAGVPLTMGDTADPLRPLPAPADAACSPGHAADPCSYVPRSGDTPHAVPAGLPHRTHRNQARDDEAVLPAQPAGARLPMPRG